MWSRGACEGMGDEGLGLRVVKEEGPAGLLRRALIFFAALFAVLFLLVRQ